MSEKNLSAMSATTSVPRAGETKRTIFLLVKTRRTNRQSSRPPVVYRNVINNNIRVILDRVEHRGVYISRGMLLLRSDRSQERLNRPMERKTYYLFNQSNGKENVIYQVLQTNGKENVSIHKY